jgi:hypothetical protein
MDERWTMENQWWRINGMYRLFLCSSFHFHWILIIFYTCLKGHFDETFHFEFVTDRHLSNSFLIESIAKISLDFDQLRPNCEPDINGRSTCWRTTIPSLIFWICPWLTSHENTYVQDSCAHVQGCPKKPMTATVIENCRISLAGRYGFVIQYGESSTYFAKSGFNRLFSTKQILYKYQNFLTSRKFIDCLIMMKTAFRGRMMYLMGKPKLL